MISPVKVWRRQRIIRNILGKEGKIITWTKIFTAGADFKKQAPYLVVLVEMEDKSRVVGQLVDSRENAVGFGKKVKAILRKVKEPTKEGIIPYGIKFKLANNS